MDKHIYSIDEWKTLENILSDNIEIKEDDEIEETHINNDNNLLNHDQFEINWNYSIMDELAYNISEDFYEMNVSDLKKIMKYYKLSIGRMKKDKIIQTLISFEMETKNDEIVGRRRKYWQYMYELINDETMSDYIHNF